MRRNYDEIKTTVCPNCCKVVHINLGAVKDRCPYCGAAIIIKGKEVEMR